MLMCDCLQTMLHNDTQNRREYVVRVLLKVVKVSPACCASNPLWWHIFSETACSIFSIALIFLITNAALLACRALPRKMQSMVGHIDP